MNLALFKEHLKNINEISFLKPNGDGIPKHFHITEVGQINKQYIDCGGTIRAESIISMQLWESVDFWHRLNPSKLLSIIELSEKKLGICNHEIEIEYQGETIGKYGIEFADGVFKLIKTHTNCLASDKCGIPKVENIKEKLIPSCNPNSGCC